MKNAAPIACVFRDIGGVLLTDGWDHHARKRAAMKFKLDLAEMQERHDLTSDTYEERKLMLREYLDRAVFYQRRSLIRAQFRRFMFARSKPFPAMIRLFAQLKARHGMKIPVVSNEARELNAYRIRTFTLDRFVDFLVSSCSVHIRKAGAEIFRLALDIAQVPARRVLYVEDTPMLVQIAVGLGIRSILHTEYMPTRTKLASFGLENDEGVIHEAS